MAIQIRVEMSVRLTKSWDYTKAVNMDAQHHFPSTSRTCAESHSYKTYHVGSDTYSMYVVQNKVNGYPTIMCKTRGTMMQDMIDLCCFGVCYFCFNNEPTPIQKTMMTMMILETVFFFRLLVKTWT